MERACGGKKSRKSDQKTRQNGSEKGYKIANTQLCMAKRSVAGSGEAEKSNFEKGFAAAAERRGKEEEVWTDIRKEGNHRGGIIHEHAGRGNAICCGVVLPRRLGSLAGRVSHVDRTVRVFNRFYGPSFLEFMGRFEALVLSLVEIFSAEAHPSLPLCI